MLNVIHALFAILCTAVILVFVINVMRFFYAVFVNDLKSNNKK